MNISHMVVIRHGTQLTDKEIEQINIAKAKQWQIPPLEKREKENTLYFLLKNEQNEMLAQGELIEIDGIIFNNESFTILGIGGIIAYEWSKGYGRQLMTAMKEYISKHKKTAVGFTNKPEFYEKCGFSIDVSSKKRFVHLKDGKRITDKVDEAILYLNGDDKFMEKVLTFPDHDVLLPVTPNW